MARRNLLTLVALVAELCSAAPLDARSQVGTKVAFYVWGNNIPGLHIYNADGAAVFTDVQTASTTNNLVPVSFTVSPRQSPQGQGYVLMASPDTTAAQDNKASNNPPFSNATWFVSGRNSASHNVGFLSERNNNNRDPVTSNGEIRTEGFLLGGGFLRLVETDGLVLPTVFCAFPTAIPGIWSLSWNETAESHGVPVTLRTTKFPAGSAPPQHEQTECRTMK